MKIFCDSEIVITKISTLKLDPNNRNKHPADQIARLAKILRENGWRYPIKVSNQTGLVRSGHARIEAAKLNKWDSVPVQFQNYDTLEQEYADSIADNAIASWAELDISGINADLKSLIPDFDLELLGIRNFNINKDFEPGTEEDQGQLDTKQPNVVLCPNCGECFDANEAKVKN